MFWLKISIFCECDKRASTWWMMTFEEETPSTSKIVSIFSLSLCLAGSRCFPRSVILQCLYYYTISTCYVHNWSNRKFFTFGINKQEGKIMSVWDLFLSPSTISPAVLGTAVYIAGLVHFCFSFFLCSCIVLLSYYMLLPWSKYAYCTLYVHACYTYSLAMCEYVCAICRFFSFFSLS